jgi:predicted DNA-binding transcriptional regulator YafY
MPINRLALIRYKTIDQCLQNRYRKWTLEDLMDACSDALFEYEGIGRGISKRTIQLDLQNMRSEKLGYNAPIVVVDKKYYTYEDKNYSITNIPLSHQDLGTLNEVVEILKQFKGFSYFQDLSGMLTRLEDKVYKQQHKGKSYIDFEKNELLKGLEFIDPLHKYITGKKTILLQYQSFKASTASELIFYPYLLKEYRNRWFVMGNRKKGSSFMILALDRIVSIQESTEKYVKADFDIFTYFDNVIGVTKMPHQREQLIVMKINPQHAPYVKTKPLHPSQQILQETPDGMIFSIRVVWNFELEREILGFGELIEVLSPKRLKRSILNRVKKSLDHYALSENE